MAPSALSRRSGRQASGPAQARPVVVRRRVLPRAALPGRGTLAGQMVPPDMVPVRRASASVGARVRAGPESVNPRRPPADPARPPDTGRRPRTPVRPPPSRGRVATSAAAADRAASRRPSSQARRRPAPTAHSAEASASPGMQTRPAPRMRARTGQSGVAPLPQDLAREDGSARRRGPAMARRMPSCPDSGPPRRPSRGRRGQAGRSPHWGRRRRAAVGQLARQPGAPPDHVRRRPGAPLRSGPRECGPG